MKKTIVAFTLVMICAFTGFSAATHAEDNMTAQRLLEGFRDNYAGHTYKNITDMERFVASLGDPYTPDTYGAIMERSRFAALYEDNRESYADTDMCELASLSLQFERK